MDSEFLSEHIRNSQPPYGFTIMNINRTVILDDFLEMLRKTCGDEGWRFVYKTSKKYPNGKGSGIFETLKPEVANSLI